MKTSNSRQKEVSWQLPLISPLFLVSMIAPVNEGPPLWQISDKFQAYIFLLSVVNFKLPSIFIFAVEIVRFFTTCHLHTVEREDFLCNYFSLLSQCGKWRCRTVSCLSGIIYREASELIIYFPAFHLNLSLH